jgi:hypothetical protein
MPPDYAAQEIRDMVRFWLEHEEMMEIDPMVLAIREAMAGRDNLPYRTMTALAFYVYGPVLEQAAEAMNLTWALRGEPYNFDINITSYDWDGRQSALERLSTMLMAGQGYDMFTINFNYLPSLWNWAESGLLTDIWELIDSDTSVSREDFYINVLDSFVMNDGLWAFPVTFGFEYIGINSALPQSVIDRFSQYDKISVREAMEIFNYLQSNYDEFGHLYFSTGGFTSRRAEVMIRELVGFIDFENQTSRLTDERFISFLEILRRTHPHLESHPLAEWYFNIASRDVMGERAEQFVFYVNDHGHKTSVALLPQRSPYYVHHIPLTDDFGRLRMRIPSPNPWGIWAALGFPATADSELAWEFTLHLVDAMMNPVGIAQFHPVFTAVPSAWGDAFLTTPILRELAVSVQRRGLVTAINFGGDMMTDTQHLLDPAAREQAIESVINRMAVYNEMPISPQPFFPYSLRLSLIDDLEQFMRGITTAESAAMQMHNRVQLWLME